MRSLILGSALLAVAMAVHSWSKRSRLLARWMGMHTCSENERSGCRKADTRVSPHEATTKRGTDPEVDHREVVAKRDVKGIDPTHS